MVDFHGYFRKAVASVGIKPPDAGTRGLHGHLKPVPVRLGPNGTDRGSERPQN